jgi:hypothetical protein
MSMTVSSLMLLLLAGTGPTGASLALTAGTGSLASGKRSIAGTGIKREAVL